MSNDAPSADEMQSLRDKLIEKYDIKEQDPNTLQNLCNYLREHAKQKGLEEDYAEATKSNNLFERLKKDINYVSSKNTTRSTSENSEPTPKGKDKKVDWDHLLEEHEKETEERSKELDDQQKAEMQKFEEYWFEKMPVQYRKPTTNFLQLKKIEKSLAISGKYDQANNIHVEAEKQNSHDQEVQQNQLNTDYTQALIHLQKKQAEQRKKFDEIRANKKFLLQNGKEQSEGQKVNRVKVLQTKEDLDKNRPVQTPVSSSSSSSHTYIDKKKKKEDEGFKLEPLNKPEKKQGIPAKQRGKSSSN